MLDTEDPSLWFDKLKLINEKLGTIGSNYMKNDYDMIGHIFVNLPRVYE